MGYGKISNYPGGFSYGVNLRGLPILNTYAGNIFWVDSVVGSDGNKGTFDLPFKTLDYTVGRCTANNGDIIMLKPGHIETVIEAGGLDLDVAGITVIFLGEGTDKAYVTFTTAVTADMDVDAANITLINPRFVAGIDSLTGPIDVNSTDFTIINGEWHDATDIETTDCLVATAGATRLCIDGWKFFCGTETGNQKQSNIQTDGCDDIVLRNIDIRGDFFVGCIENVTDEVLNARLENLNLENLNATPKPALFLDANATGTCKNMKLHVASGTTYANSYGKMAYDNQCEGFTGTTSPAGDRLGTAAAADIETRVVTIASDLVVADALIDTIKSDLIVTNAIVDTIASDLIVADALIDGEVVKTTTIASDLVVADALIDTVKSDLIVLDAIVDGEVTKTATIASDLILVDTVVDSVKSDLIVLDAIVDGEVTKTTTIASDLILVDTVVDTIKSDLIVVDALVDTIKSDFISFKTEWDTFETIMSDFVVKYASDNP